MKKIAIIVTAMTLVLIAGKTGYSYWKNLPEQKEDLSERKENSLEQDLSEQNSSEQDVSEQSEKGIVKISDARKAFGSTGSPVSMFDKNDNIKDGEAYEKEIYEYYESGQINSDELEYYLFMFRKCVETYGSGTTDSYDDSDLEPSIRFNKNASLTPSCH